MDVSEVVQVRLDEKHHMELRINTNTRKFYIALVKTGNGQEIDLTNEPVIVFRGRDKLAVPMLEYYRNLCEADECTDYQFASLDKMIDAFSEFAENSPTMKQPGITGGK